MKRISSTPSTTIPPHVWPHFATSIFESALRLLPIGDNRSIEPHISSAPQLPSTRNPVRTQLECDFLAKRQPCALCYEHKSKLNTNSLLVIVYR